MPPMGESNAEVCFVTSIDCFDVRMFVILSKDKFDYTNDIIR